MLLKKITINIIIMLAILIVCPSAWAATYYVSASNGNDSNPGTLSSPWKTIGKANSALRAGDTAYIRGGTYSGQYINPSNSGTSSAHITYSNYENEKVTVKDAAYGVKINGKTYVNVTGINFFNLDHFLYISGGGHNTISYCTFDTMRNYTWHGSRIYNSSQYNWVHHNTFSRWGGGKGAMFDIGNEFVTTDKSYYNLVEDNTLYYGGHHVLGLYSRYSVVRNNYIHNEVNGTRDLISEGQAAEFNLVEGNRLGFTKNAGSGFTLSSQKNIVRLNSFYNNGRAGIAINNDEPGMLPANYNHIYNNTFFNNGHDEAQSTSCGLLVSDWGGGDPIGNVIKNNIFHKNYNNRAIKYSGVSTLQIISDNWEEEGNPYFVNSGGTDPFNSSLPNLQIEETSPARDSGNWLTTITSPSASGTSFQVRDALYFMDGWNIIEGDTIQLQGQNITVKITNVNYDTNTITVDKTLKWSKDQGVSLAYNGSAPDLGAHEVGATPLGIKAPTGLKIVAK